MAWHDAGTVNVTLNSANVVGVSTSWLAGARAGDAFQGPDGRLYEVLNVASNTSITLTTQYRGPTATGQKYSLIPVHGYLKRSADLLASIAQDLGGLPARVTAVENGRLIKASNLSDVPDKATARTNLGLGSAALVNVTALLAKVDNLAGLANIAAARSNLGLKSAALAELLGDVGAGAAMQSGTGNDGRWWRFANGLQVCARRYPWNGGGVSVNHGWPAAFAQTPYTLATTDSTAASSATMLNVTTTSFSYITDAHNGTVNLMGVGLWKLN